LAGEQRGCDWNRIGGKQLRDIDRIKPGASVLQRALDHAAGSGDVGLEILRQARRRRHQRLQRLAIAHEMHESAHRVGFGGVARNAGRFEDRRGGIAASDPHGKNGLWSDEAVAMRLRAGGDRSRGGVRRRERRRNVHDQDGVVLPILQQRFEGGDVARRIGVAGDIDGVCARPDRRQLRVEPLHRRR
jgi:hypothetical protein